MSATKRNGKNIWSWTTVQDLGHPWDAPLCHHNALWGMQYMRSIHFAHHRGVKGTNGRNTTKGGQEGLLHCMAEHCSSDQGWGILRVRQKVEWYSDHHDNMTNDVRLAEEKASAKQDHHWEADEKLVQANSRIAELEAKLPSSQKEISVLQQQDKRTPIYWHDLYDFLDSESEPTSGRSSQKRKKSQAFPPYFNYGGFLPDEAGTSVPVDEQMLASSQAVGSQTTLLIGHSPMSRITPLGGKGDPSISVTGMLPRPLKKTWAGCWNLGCKLSQLV